jgi:hypothetical protein
MSLFANAPTVPEQDIFIPNLTHLDRSQLLVASELENKVKIRIEAAEIKVTSWHQMQENANLLYKLEN